MRPMGLSKSVWGFGSVNLSLTLKMHFVGWDVGSYLRSDEFLSQLQQNTI